MRKIFLIIFLVGAAQLSWAQAEEYIYTDTTIIENNNKENYSDDKFEPSSDLPTDTLANINFREISWDTINGIRRSKDFAYMRTLDSLLHVKEKVSEPVNPRTGFWYNFFNSSLLKIFLWFLAVFFIGFIIYQVFLKNFAFRRRDKKLSIQPETNEEVIQEGDFEMILQDAKTNGNYRHALRCLFLISMKKLADADLVQFDQSRTNAEYARELRPQYSSGFREILRIYERAWYGKMPVSPETFLVYEEKFISFNNSIIK